MKNLPMIVRVAGGLLFVTYLWGMAAHGAELAASRNQLLAAFVLNFAKFTSWQGAKFKAQAEGASIQIAVAGDADFAEKLTEVVKARAADAKPSFQVSSASMESLKSANIVVSLYGEEDKNLDILKKLKGCQCLTVTFQEGLASKGSVINFYTEDDKFRFEINLSKSKSENLEISSLLLKLGKVIP